MEYRYFARLWGRTPLQATAEQLGIDPHPKIRIWADRPLDAELLGALMQRSLAVDLAHQVGGALGLDDAGPEKYDNTTTNEGEPR